MPRRKRDPSSSAPKSTATTPEAYENELINLAYCEAAKRIRDGTASDTLLTHFLRAGSARDRLERQILEQKRELDAAKTEAIKGDRASAELYQEVLDQFRVYRGEV